MEEIYIDEELLDNLLSSNKIWIINDIKEEHTCNWNIILAVSECRKIMQDKYHIKVEIDKIDDKLYNAMLDEIDRNLRK